MVTIPVATGQTDMMDLDPSDPQGRLLLLKDQFCVLSILLLVDNSLECRCRAIFLDNTVACEVRLAITDLSSLSTEMAPATSRPESSNS